MNVLDGRGLGNAQHVDQISQILGMVGKLGSAEIGFGELQRMDHGAHGAIQNQNSLREQLL